MKNIYPGILCVSLFFIVACHGNETANTKQGKPDSSYSIIGKVTGQDNGMIYIIHRQSGLTDSAALDHGFFKFSGKADTAEFCRLRLGGQTKGFFLENGKIAMLVKKDSLDKALISGTKVQDDYNYFQNLISKPLNDRMAEAEKAYDAANNKKNIRAMDSLDQIFEALDLEQKQLAMDYTKSHPTSIVSAYEIYSNFFYNPRLGQLDSLYQELDTHVRKTYFGRLIQNTITKVKLTAIGNPAPDFTSNDINGKPVSLSSFKGKYILLDFWAAWCGPCRRENPTIVKAFHNYHNKGFDIFGVSLDDDRSEWIEAIKKDGLSWTQVSDLKGWKSAVADLYGVQGIPMNYLLDKNGIIVAKGLRGEELSSKLAELLH
jgi:peroxiredoxin